MKPELRLALLISTVSLSIINNAFADKMVDGYIEELDDGSEVIRIQGKERILTFVIDNGRFQIDTSFLEEVYDLETGLKVEPALPTSAQLLESAEGNGDTSVMSPGSLAPSLSSVAAPFTGTPGGTSSGVYNVKLSVVPADQLPPVPKPVVAGIPGITASADVDLSSISAMGDIPEAGNPFLEQEAASPTAVSLVQTELYQSQALKTPVISQEEIDALYAADQVIKINGLRIKLGLPYEEQQFINVSSEPSPQETRKEESSLQIKYGDQVIDRCTPVPREEVNALEGQLEEERKEAGYTGVARKLLSMDINIIYDEALKGVPKIDPQRIIDDINGIIARFSQNPERRRALALLLTFGIENDMGIALYHPAARADVSETSEMILLDTRLPVGHATVDAVARYLAHVALMKVKKESEELRRAAEKQTVSDKNVINVYEMLQRQTRTFLNIASSRLTQQEMQLMALMPESRLDQTLEGIMVYLQYKEMGTTISSMQTFYAEHQHSDLWWLLTTMEDLYQSDPTPVHFAVPYHASKQLLRLPVMGEPLDLFGAGVKMKVRVADQSDESDDEPEIDSLENGVSKVTRRRGRSRK